MIGVCWALSDSCYGERGQGHLLVPLPTQKVLLLQQHPQQGRTASIVPALTLILFEMQKPGQRRWEMLCSWSSHWP